MSKLFFASGGREPSDPALKKLRNRLLLINIVSLTVVIAVSMSVIYLATYNRVQNEITARLRAIPAGVSENILLWREIRNASELFAPEGVTISPGGGLIVGGGINFPIDYDKSFVANVLADGQIKIFSLIEMSDREYFSAVQRALSGSGTQGPLLIRGEPWNYHVVTSVPGEGVDSEVYQTSVVFLNTEEESIRLNGLAFSLLVIGLSSVAVILLLSYFFANRAMVPVQSSMDRQRRFVADASHELKTPLTVIAMNAEAAKGATDAGEIAGNLANIETETVRMDGLVRHLLTLAREEETKPLFSSFDLSEAVEEETDRVEAILFEKGIDFSFQKPEIPVLVHTDREKLKTAVGILLDNAVKYTPDGGLVSVLISLASGKIRTQITIENTGDHLQPEDLSQIFDRFYRTDKSHNSGTGGHGIGLSIAKETVQSLGGQIRAESIPRAEGSAVNSFIITL